MCDVTQSGLAIKAALDNLVKFATVGGILSTNFRFGRGSIGGFTLLAVVLCVGVSVVGVTWAIFGSGDTSSPVFFASVFGILGCAFSLLSVRWRVDGDKLTVKQWGISKNVEIQTVSNLFSSSDMTWKQGVGIRWAGPGELAMVCGSKDVVTVEYLDRVFHFSADNGDLAVEAIRQQKNT